MEENSAGGGPFGRHGGSLIGFTLLEMSVVLVIIGLMIGGVLVGRELILASELRSVMTQVSRYDTAVLTFRSKYGGLPGDHPEAVLLGLSETGCPVDGVPSCDSAQGGGTQPFGGCNGNGNGVLDSDSGSLLLEGCPEMLGFWYHLSRSGLIEGGFDGTSRTSYAASLEYMSGPVYGMSGPVTQLHGVGIAVLANDYYIGLSDSWSLGQNQQELLVEEAWKLDEKMDDGVASRGRITTNLRHYLDPTCTVATDPSAYDVRNSDGRCALAIHITGFDRHVHPICSNC